MLLELKMVFSKILYLYLLILLSFSFNDNGGVMVRLEIVCSSPGRDKPKTMEIVFVAASANYAALRSKIKD